MVDRRFGPTSHQVVAVEYQAATEPPPFPQIHQTLPQIPQTPPTTDIGTSPTADPQLPNTPSPSSKERYESLDTFW
jgi:hypothetical protein